MAITTRELKFTHMQPPKYPWLTKTTIYSRSAYDEEIGLEHSPVSATGSGMGAHGVARDAAGGVEGVAQGRRFIRKAR